MRLEEIKAKALLTQKWRGLFMVAVREGGGGMSIPALSQSLCGLQHASDYTAKGETCVRPTSESHRPHNRSLVKLYIPNAMQKANLNTEHTS